MQQATIRGDFESWQETARALLAENIRPEDILWVEQSEELFLKLGEQSNGIANKEFKVPREFLEAARLVARHCDPGKWKLLYLTLWRLTHGETNLLQNPIDSATIELRHYAKEVEKDAYRMKAFLRFREVRAESGSWFVAWYEPEHDTVECNAEFFVGRFANIRWSILTPKRCMHWDGTALSFSAGVTRTAAPKDDEIEPLWLTYYSSIFNPARIKPEAMQAQLLKRNWKNLPEAVLIEPLLREAPRRTASMVRESARRVLPDPEFSLAAPPKTADLLDLRDAATRCRACPLYKRASCTVFGEGPREASIMLVGEQPGDQEDRSGRAFVGPAGQLLNAALSAAGLERERLYVTNAVKHFKWEPRGKRRIHQTPNSRDIAACRPWLVAEINAVQPKLIVCLGGTAVQAILESSVPVKQNRGSFQPTAFRIPALITVHPSSMLRMPDLKQREIDFGFFVSDLRKAAQAGTV